MESLVFTIGDIIALVSLLIVGTGALWAVITYLMRAIDSRTQQVSSELSEQIKSLNEKISALEHGLRSAIRENKTDNQSMYASQKLELNTLRTELSSKYERLNDKRAESIKDLHDKIDNLREKLYKKD